MLWIAFIVLGVVAALFAAWPLLRRPTRRTALGASAMLFVVVSAAALYGSIGSPGLPSGAGQPEAASLPDVEAMVESLAARLEREPDDVAGWKMLGRSYLTLGRYAEAVRAYQRVVAMESPQSPDTLVSLGEAMLAASGQNLTPESAALFESALALNPNHPAALFWAGIVSINRGDRMEAASRWQRLLATNPPPEVRTVIEQRIAEWRGEAQPATSPAPEQPGPVVTASLEVSDAAAAALPADATVFVIARDPAQPTPPIAVTRRRLSELPAAVELGDGDSMIPGRTLSGFESFELVARVSLSGAPAAQAGDWFGSAIVTPSQSNRVTLSIDSRVP